MVKADVRLPKPRRGSRRTEAPRKAQSITEASPSVVKLMKEQGLWGKGPPDWSALFSDVWRTPEEVDEFDRFVREIRGHGRGR
jgi:hypothetical protein